MVSLSDPAMEEALHDVPLYREFAGLGDGVSRLPDETTILRFRHLLEAHDLAADMLRVVNDILQTKGLMLRTGTAVDATLISAPSSTKNADGERDPEMRAPVPSDQMTIRLQQGALSGLGEEHGADRHAVCVVEFVDGATPIDGSQGMSASATPRSGMQGLPRWPL
jgi:IS5 family transposase